MVTFLLRVRSFGGHVHYFGGVDLCNGEAKVGGGYQHVSSPIIEVDGQEIVRLPAARLT